MDDPFAQLLRSHRRLEERLVELEDAAARLGGDGDRQARAAIADVVGWLGRAVRRHEEDEERSLFPRLAGEADLQPLLERLRAEHRAQEALARTLANDGPAAELTEAARALVASYRAHLRAEEESLFPACRDRLDGAALAEMAAEMAARREGGGGGGGGGGRRRAT